MKTQIPTRQALEEAKADLVKALDENDHEVYFGDVIGKHSETITAALDLLLDREKVFVPVEPTDEMNTLGSVAIPAYCHDAERAEDAAESAYERMIAASPFKIGEE